MSSTSLTELDTALEEVSELISLVTPAPLWGGTPGSREVRAICRAGIVLSCSHFEAYLYGINLQAVDTVNVRGAAAAALSLRLRLAHSRKRIADIAASSWEGEARSRQLAEFVAADGWLWSHEHGGKLESEQLLTWMKSPTPDAVVRYFRMWGVEDVFVAITRRASTRGIMRARLEEMVTKRNNIAHGDAGESASLGEVREYLRTTRSFCRRADARLAREIARITGGSRPW